MAAAINSEGNHKAAGVCLHDAEQGHAETPAVALSVPLWGQQHRAVIRAHSAWAR